MNTDTSKHDRLHLIRSIACLSIIWYHMSPPINWLFFRGVNLSAITRFWGGPYVFIFYLLSGYAIGYGFFSQKYTFLRSSLWKFYVKRFLRIAPIYYLVLLVCYLFIYPDKPKIIGDIVRYITFTANDPSSLPFGGTHAIVSTEMQFYLVAPVLLFFLMAVLKYVPVRFVALLIFLASFIIRFVLVAAELVGGNKEWAMHVYTQVYGNLDLFLFGALLSYISINQFSVIAELKKKISLRFFLIILFFGALITNYLTEGIGEWNFVILYRVYTLPVLVSLVIGMVILILSTGRKVRPIGSYNVKDIVFLLVHPRTFLYGIGILSYGIYLWHYPIFYYFFLRSNSVIESWTHFFFRYIVVLITTLLLSLLSYALLERPLLTGVYANSIRIFIRKYVSRDFSNKTSRQLQ